MPWTAQTEAVAEREGDGGRRGGVKDDRWWEVVAMRARPRAARVARRIPARKVAMVGE